MASTNKEFRHESIKEKELIIDYIDKLIEGFRNNKITLSDLENEYIYYPNGLIKFEIKAKNKEKREKISIKFSWQEKDNTKSSNTLFIL